jgi:hypothetical protein
MLDYIPHTNCSLDSAAFDKLRPRARRGEPFDPEPFDPELKAEGLKAEGLVAGSTKS